MKNAILVVSFFVVPLTLGYALNMLGGGPQLWVSNPGVDSSYGLTILPGGIVKSPKELKVKNLFLDVSSYINPHCLFWRLRTRQLFNAKAGYNKEMERISLAVASLNSQRDGLETSVSSTTPMRVNLQMEIDKASRSLVEARPNVVRWCGPNQANAIFSRNS